MQGESASNDPSFVPQETCSVWLPTESITAINASNAAKALAMIVTVSECAVT